MLQNKHLPGMSFGGQLNPGGCESTTCASINEHKRVKARARLMTVSCRKRWLAVGGRDPEVPRRNHGYELHQRSLRNPDTLTCWLETFCSTKGIPTHLRADDQIEYTWQFAGPAALLIV